MEPIYVKEKKENESRNTKIDNAGSTEAILTESVPDGLLRTPAEQYQSSYQKAQPGPSFVSTYWLHDMLQ